MNRVVMFGQNITLRGNTVRAGDGGIGQSRPDLWLADALGGGAAFQASTVSINGLTVTDNQSTAGSGSSFGGSGNGGGLFFEFAVGSLSNGMIKENETVGGASATGLGGIGGGGGIMATDTTLTLDGLEILANRAIGGAGSSTAVPGQRGAGHAGGGAMYFTDAPAPYGPEPMNVTGTNLILAGNHAEAGVGAARYGGGGAIFSQDATVTLRHATVASNRVLTTMLAPAMIALNNFGQSTIQLSHSIVSHHATAAAPQAIIAQRTGDVVNLNGVLFFGNAGNAGTQAGQAGGVINTSNPVAVGDPLFASAPTFNYELTTGSAALDRAHGSTIPYDLRGLSRPCGAAADVGAHEKCN